MNFSEDFADISNFIGRGPGPQPNRETKAAYSKSVLSNTIRNEQKMSDRKALLEKNPELRINVNVENLRKVIPNFDFRCHPDCSVARNQAMKNSDIDGGLVITDDPVSKEDQLKFVDELKHEGFKAVTEEQADHMKILNHSLDEIKEYRKQNGLEGYSEDNQITFRTREQLEDLVKSGEVSSKTNVYLAGYQIN